MIHAIISKNIRERHFILLHVINIYIHRFIEEYMKFSLHTVHKYDIYVNQFYFKDINSLFDRTVSLVWSVIKSNKNRSIMQYTLYLF